MRYELETEISLGELRKHEKWEEMLINNNFIKALLYKGMNS